MSSRTVTEKTTFQVISFSHDLFKFQGEPNTLTPTLHTQQQSHHDKPSILPDSSGYTFSIF